MKIASIILFWLSIFLSLAMIALDWGGVSVPSLLVTLFCSCIFLVIFIGVIRHDLFFFVFKRIGSSIFVIGVIATLTFLLLHFLPGGPFDEEKILMPEVKKNIDKKYGLDKPILEQYITYMGGLVQGNLGYSYKYEGRAVSEIIKGSLPVSFKLGFYSLLLSFLIGIPLGLLAAAKHGTKTDSVAMVLAMSGISLPSFLIAPILIYIFSFGWPIHYFSPNLHQWMLDYNTFLPPALWHSPVHYILPVITLSIRPAAFIARLTRSSVLDFVQEDFVRTARSKGLSERVIFFHHVLKNALTPILTYSGPLVAGILSGSFVVEVIYAIPGIAKYFIQGVFNRDYPLIMALTILFSMMLVLANLVVDILYRVADPRMDV